MLTARAIPSFPEGSRVPIAALTLLAVLSATAAAAADAPACGDEPSVGVIPAGSVPTRGEPGAAPPAAAPADAAAPPVVPATTPAAPRPPARPDVPPSVAGRPPEERRARATAAGIVLELRSDVGFSRFVEVEFTNDRRVSLNLNDGIALAAGVSFLPLGGGRFMSRLSAGVKLDRVRAHNGSALFTAFPVDLMEGAYVGPLRVGAGVSVLLGPRVRGDGFLEPAAVRFGPTPGVVADAEWIVAPKARTGIGLRASWYRFAREGSVRGAPSVGLVIRADFDVAGR